MDPRNDETQEAVKQLMSKIEREIELAITKTLGTEEWVLDDMKDRVEIIRLGYSTEATDQYFLDGRLILEIYPLRLVGIAEPFAMISVYRAWEDQAVRLSVRRTRNFDSDFDPAPSNVSTP